MYHALDRAAGTLARVMALAGGTALLGIVALTCLSIAGRALVRFGIGPGAVRGIYDYTEIAMAAAVFAFLPWCQYRRGHASVDLLKPLFPRPLNRALDALFDLAMLGLAVVLALRLWLGMSDMRTYGDTTQIAQVPVWIGFALSFAGAVTFVLVAAFCALRGLRALFPSVPDTSEPHV